MKRYIKRVVCCLLGCLLLTSCGPVRPTESESVAGEPVVPAYSYPAETGGPLVSELSSGEEAALGASLFAMHCADPQMPLEEIKSRIQYDPV